MDISSIRALAFDVFGTVVDWRGSLIREGEAINRAKGIAVDWAAFADDWRRLYQPQLERVRSGALPWTRLDELHRMGLEELVPRYGLEGFSGEELAHLNRAWHRLDPWPDAVTGLSRLKRKYVLATLSNGNVALLVNMAKRAGLPWDAVLGAEVARHYKPQPEAYLTTVDLLGLLPAQCMMVAAHPADLVSAATCGLRTAYVSRPLEFGAARAPDVHAQHAFDVTASDFLDLARQLGC